ncbi:MAG: transcriptional repressor NrdR [Clostridia bacterium]|nr:transcriptional repressor NrdR [Clostridia bacterium]
MKCPFCSYAESKVIDSRPTDEGTIIRRRRECMSCEKRFTTYEKIEAISVMVIKRDNSRQLFDGDKLMAGLLRACEKRKVSRSQLEEVVAKIENAIYNTEDKELPTTVIGEMVMDELRELDAVAYIRFASVYRDFDSVETFLKELKILKKQDKPVDKN